MQQNKNTEKFVIFSGFTGIFDDLDVEGMFHSYEDYEKNFQPILKHNQDSEDEGNDDQIEHKEGDGLFIEKI